MRQIISVMKCPLALVLTVTVGSHELIKALYEELPIPYDAQGGKIPARTKWLTENKSRTKTWAFNSINEFS